MSPELENLSREELVDEIRELREENQMTQARMNALSNQVQIIKRALTGNEDNFYELDGFGENQNVIAWLLEIESTVETNRDKLRGFKTSEGQLSEDDRITIIRQYLVDRAKENNTNVYGADYKEIRALFDGEISDSWSHTLMTKAAGTFPDGVEKPKEGFEVADTKPRKKVRVHADKITDGSFL